MTEPRKTPRSKQVAGLAATLERYAETYHACACNEADRWEAGRFLEAAKQLRALEAETQELAEALEDLLGPYRSGHDAFAKIAQAEAAIARTNSATVKEGA